MSKFALAIVLSLLIPTAFAAEKPSRMERVDLFLASKIETGHRWRAFFAVECLGGASEKWKWFAEFERRKGTLPAFSDAWCVREGFPSQKLRLEGVNG